MTPCFLFLEITIFWNNFVALLGFEHFECTHRFDVFTELIMEFSCVLISDFLSDVFARQTRKSSSIVRQLNRKSLNSFQNSGYRIFPVLMTSSGPNFPQNILIFQSHLLSHYFGANNHPIAFRPVLTQVGDISRWNFERADQTALIGIFTLFFSIFFSEEHIADDEVEGTKNQNEGKIHLKLK